VLIIKTPIQNTISIEESIGKKKKTYTGKIGLMPHCNYNDQGDGELTLDTPNTAYANSYAIVVSSATLNDSDWSRVISHLFGLHPQANQLVYSDGTLESIAEHLRGLMPRYVAFVCRPTECGRVFVGQCHRLMRTLDNEPYIDAMWSIITGIDAEHAIKSIDNECVAQPFIIRSSINFTNVDHDLFESSFTFSDAHKGCWSGKNCALHDESGEEQHQGQDYPRAPALIFMEKFNNMQPDLLVTSGHGTEHSVEMPWSLGKLEVSECGLMPLDHSCNPVAPTIEASTNPKIFLPIANCLVGHCVGPHCMVTTFLGRLGVRQMCGYTVRTWFGRAGWGTLDLWKSVPGRLALVDAYFLHQAHMTYELKSINPRLLNFQLDLTDEDPGYETVVPQLDQQYHLPEANIDDEILKQIYGLAYDRDTFVFYGDPAFIAKLDENRSDPLLKTKFLRTSGNTHQFVIDYKDAETAQKFHLPIGNVFTNRIENFNIINGFEYEPILADNFLVVLKPKPKDPNCTTIKIDFRGTIIM
jgi:hypothetical protein